MTGILPVALEDATKILQALILTGKEYICVMQLHGKVPEQLLREVMGEFTGEIYQRPPLRASVKRRIRTRTIYYLDLFEIQEPFVLFKVGCQAGTYIRKICHDLGEALGCGAHMKELRRTRVGPLTEDQTLTKIHDLIYAYTAFRDEGDEIPLRRAVQPVEHALSLLPKIYIRDSAVDAICHGAHLALPGVVKVETGIKPGDVVAVFTLKGEIVSLAQAALSTEELMRRGHGIAARTLRVIMTPNTYPRRWKRSAKG